MVPRIAIIVGALASVGIIVMLVVQQRQISELAAEVSALRVEASSADSGHAAAASPPSAEPPNALATRIDRLEAQVGHLQGSEPVPPGEPIPNRKVDPAAEKEERTEPAQKAVRKVLESDPGVRDQFKTIVREEQDRLAEESRSERENRIADGRRASLEELAKKVNLSTVQMELLDDVLGTEREKMLEVFRQVREDGLSKAEAAAQVEAIRMATDKEVDGELEDDQFSGFQEMRPTYRVGSPPPWRR